MVRAPTVDSISRCVALISKARRSGEAIARIQMGEGVIADRVPFAIDALKNVGVERAGRTNDEKGRLHAFVRQNVEDLGRVSWVGPSSKVRARTLSLRAPSA